MKNIGYYISVLLLVLSSHSVVGQKNFGFKLPRKQSRVAIPFELHNNLAVVPITINETLTLKFIIDSGVETAILTEKLFADLLNCEYQRTIVINGPGLADSIHAHVATGLRFSIDGRVVGQNMNLLVLDKDYLKLSESIGDDIYGIIGYDLFRIFITEINYDKKELVLSKFNKKRRYKNFSKIPIDLTASKPFIPTKVKSSGQVENLDMLIDTGASHAALIDFNEVNEIELPEKLIPTSLGRGIGGEIFGSVGRLDEMSIKDFSLSNIIVSAPNEGAYNNLIKRGARKGTIGGDLLKRFTIALDYHRKKIYLRKSSSYKEPFEFNMSGLDLNVTGSTLDTLKAIAVYKDRPAYNAGIRKGDIIISINGKTISNNELSYFYRLMRRKEGQLIKVKYMREGLVEKTQFRLKREI